MIWTIVKPVKFEIASVKIRTQTSEMKISKVTFISGSILTKVMKSSLNQPQLLTEDNVSRDQSPSFSFSFFSASVSSPGKINMNVIPISGGDSGILEISRKKLKTKKVAKDRSC